MNKKLFGTLLLGSLLLGGTFVSCKDYDDDIDNLQSQVDALKSSAALKTDVDGLKSSLEGAISAAQNAATAAKSAADAADKKASEATSELAKKAAQADLEAAQAKLAAAEDKLAKLEAAIAELNGLEAKLTEATAAEFDKMKKELNAEFDAIKESVSAMIQSLEIIDLKIPVTNVINNGEDILHWGVATKDIEWAGPKGNIAKGDLLVGFIKSTKALTVVPATVDLSEANIELVNSIGEAAHVSITATPASKTDAGVIVGTSRAADVQGKWNLDVAPAGVDATTIANAYASEDGKKNVAYAVSVDGRVVTGYDYEVRVEKAACTEKYTAKNVIDEKELEYVDSKKSSLVAGVDNEYKVQTSKIYDAYLTFEGNDAERAEELGIQANGLTISIPEDVTSRNDIYATLYAIDLTGTITKHRTKLSAQSGVDPDEGDVVATATTVKPGLKNSDVTIAIGTIIKGLSDSDAKQIKSIKVDNMAETPFVYETSTGIPMVGKNSYGEEVAVDGTTFDVRTIRTLVVTATATVNPQAVEGADTLKVDFMGNATDIIKTIYVPVNVVKPTAAELAAQIKVASAWNGDKLKLTYDNTKILSTQIFADNTALNEFSVGTATGEKTLVAKKTALASVHLGGYSGTTDTLGINNTPAVYGMYDAISASNPTKEWKIKTGTATFKLANVAAWTFTYNFDIEMVDAYAGYSLKWFKNGTTVTAGDKGEIKKADGTIYAYSTTQDGIAWQHTVNGVATKVDYNAATGTPMEGIATTPKCKVTMYDPANTITIPGLTRTSGKYVLTDDLYKFYATGDISTAETEATVEFAYENSFGVIRTYTMTFEFK